MVVYHLLENSGNFGWIVNGKRFGGSSNWKTPETYGSSEKVVPFSRLERFECISLFHLHVPRFSHRFQVIDDFSSYDQAPLRRSVWRNGTRSPWSDFFVNGKQFRTDRDIFLNGKQPLSTLEPRRFLAHGRTSFFARLFASRSFVTRKLVSCSRVPAHRQSAVFPMNRVVGWKTWH